MSTYSGIVVYAMVIGRLPFSSPFKDEYHRQRMLRHIQKGLAPFHDREMAFLPTGITSTSPIVFILLIGSLDNRPEV